MSKVALLVLVAQLSGCITYYAHSDIRDPDTTTQLAALDVLLGAAGGLGYYQKSHKLNLVESLALGVVTAFVVDGVFALIVTQAEHNHSN